jgi:uncharacterized protein
MSEVHVVGVRAATTDRPLLLLCEAAGWRWLAVRIGAPEATAIIMAQHGLRPPRPTVHDLLADVVAALGRELAHVRITAIRDGVFLADLVFEGGPRVSAGASDAVALALRARVPIHVDDALLAAAGLMITDGERGRPDRTADDVAAFRAFLDSVSPEDFRLLP